MKRALVITLIMAAGAAAVFAADEPVSLTQTAKKKIFMIVGAMEKVENDKYTMRKTETRYEFFLDENTPLFMREEVSSGSINENNYLVIKGPKNRNTVLANAVYVYENKAGYEAAADKKEETPDAPQKVFSALLEGVVVRTDPMVIRLADGREYKVSFDSDTYWMLVKRTNKDELKPGERIKIYFDKLYSIRLKNVPIKVIIDRVKAGF